MHYQITVRDVLDTQSAKKVSRASSRHGFALLKGIHRSFLKRVLDAFDDAEETWQKPDRFKLFMPRYAATLVHSRFATFAGVFYAMAVYFLLEKNRPATFAHLWYSLAADFGLFRDQLAQRIRF